jgi:processive 1,2-diacylglycerol beta-glucosyltransferase
MGGGSGVGPLVEVAERIAALSAAPRVVVVCGMNHRLRDQVDRLPAALAGQIRTFGFTHEVDALLEACDLVVTKAGGLTCAEALVKGTPLVLFRPTPGQEVRNTAYLESSGAAIHADTLDEVGAAVARLLADPEALARMHDAAASIAAPRAAQVIAERVLAAHAAARVAS